MWFEVVAVSDEFLKIVQNFPEASSAEYVQFCGKTIDGPKEVFLAATMDEVKDGLPKIIADLDPAFANVRIICRSVVCPACASEKQKNPDKVIRCEHGCPRVNSAWDVNIQKFLESQAVA
jgi:hypothetical protein